MLKHTLLLLCVALLAACAGFGERALRAGQTETEVVQALGMPNARHALTTVRTSGGTRLEFARGPLGRETWMVDLDASGRVTTWMQALEEPRLHAFQQRAPGMSLAELQRTLGRPADKRGAGLMGGELWSYRYPTNDCLWFQVTVGDDRRVRDAGFGIDPRCDDRRGGLW